MTECCNGARREGPGEGVISSNRATCCEASPRTLRSIITPVTRGYGKNRWRDVRDSQSSQMQPLASRVQETELMRCELRAGEPVV